MPEPSTLLLFAAAAFALIIVPGPVVLYVVARSLEQGRSAGVVSVLGAGVGAFVHILAAAVGLSALLASSVVAFSVVKYLGAAYLIYLGVRKLLSQPASASNVDIKRQPLTKIFYEGVVVNVLNPKTAIFFLAFLPQFVDASGGNAASQILILGLTFVVIGLLSDSLYALLAGTFGTYLKQSRRFLGVQHYVSGGIYVALGIGAALGGSSKGK